MERHDERKPDAQIARTFAEVLREMTRDDRLITLGYASALRDRAASVKKSAPPG